MIADLLPLLAFAAFVVIARNVFEAYVLDHAQHRMEAKELAHTRAQHLRFRGRDSGGDFRSQ